MGLNVTPAEAPAPTVSPVPPAGIWAGKAKATRTHADADGAPILVEIDWAFTAPTVVRKPDGSEGRGDPQEWRRATTYDWALQADRERFAAVCARSGLTGTVEDANDLLERPVRLRVKTRGGRTSAVIAEVLAPLPAE